MSKITEIKIGEINEIVFIGKAMNSLPRQV
jgi:hypothetical protein